VLWTKDYDALPVTTTKLEYQPCMSPTETSSPPGYSPFRAEKTVARCTQSPFNGLTYDPRYVKDGYQINMYELQEDNGVFDQKA